MAQDLPIADLSPFLNTSPIGKPRYRRISYTDLKTLGTASTGTNYLVLEYLPQGAIITFTRAKNITAATGTASATTVQIVDGTYTGTTAAPTVTAVNSYATTMALGTTVATPPIEGTGVETDITGGKPTYGTIGVVAVKVVAVGGDLSTLTAGTFDVWYDYIIL